MEKAQLVASILLALILIGFGGAYLVGQVPPMEPKSDADLAGIELLVSMREGGLMLYISLSHVVVGIMLLVPRLRFAGALLQLPVTLGILALHVAMLPAGTPPALVLLVLNTLILWDPERIRGLVEGPA